MSESKNLVLVGPVYPYKGGISHYTGLLYKALAASHKVHMLSFKVQYPKFLHKKEQKDFQEDSLEIKDTKFLLNTANPLNWIQTAHYINRLKPDYIIFQWWHPYFSPCYIALSLLTFKIKKLFTCHNIFPHERFPYDTLLTRGTLKYGCGFILHSKTEKKELLSMFPQARYKVTPHPTYNVFNFHNIQKEDARTHLQLPQNGNILLFFGLIRDYKGLKYLLNAMPDIYITLPNIHLVIAGDFGSSYNEYLILIDQLKIKNCITIFNKYILDTDVEYYFSASDLVVLPYESATQSGVVQMAYGFDKPVIVTDVGGLPEVVTHNKTGYIVPPHNTSALADAVIDYFTQNKANEFIENIKNEAYRFSWNNMVEIIESLF